jgi:hypothetical protein
MPDESWSWFRPSDGTDPPPAGAGAQPEDARRPGPARRGADWLRRAGTRGLAWAWLAGAAAVVAVGLVLAAVLDSGAADRLGRPVDRTAVVPGVGAGRPPVPVETPTPGEPSQPTGAAGRGWEAGAVPQEVPASGLSTGSVPATSAGGGQSPTQAAGPLPTAPTAPSPTVPTTSAPTPALTPATVTATPAASSPYPTIEPTSTDRPPRQDSASL